MARLIDTHYYWLICSSLIDRGTVHSKIARCQCNTVQCDIIGHALVVVAVLPWWKFRLLKFCLCKIQRIQSFNFTVDYSVHLTVVLQNYHIDD